MSGQVVKVKARTVRAVTFLPHGQRCETWLPAGLWQVQGECDLTAGNGSDERLPALILRKPVPMAQDGEWYTGRAWFQG